MQSRRITRRGTLAAGEENAIGARVTRAKVNALTADNTGALGNKTANSTIGVNPPTRGGKRSALGDVSKNGLRKTGEDKENGEPILKKVVSTKALMTTKASATNGVNKLTTRASAKGPLKAALTDEVIEREVKRSNSGSGVMGQRKRRVLNAETKSSEVVKAEAIKAEIKTTKVEKTVNTTKSTMAAVEITDVKKEKAVAKPTVKDVNEVKKEKAVAKPAVKAVAVKKAFELEADEDDNDPLMVAEYAGDIFKYLRSLEADSLPNPDYMDAQEGLQWEQRGILVDWLIEVHVKFHLLPETLYLAINIIDRFLSVKVVMIDRLQLVGITAMFIAAKYEEVFSPHIQHFRYLADDTFSEEEILRAERFMLSSLDYNLSYPNPMNFLRRISKADNYDIHTRTVAKYLMEISLVDHTLMEYLPSHVAAASMYLSRLILKRGPWDDALQYYSGYTEEEIRPVFLKLVTYCRDPQHKAFYNKYASKKYAKASILAREWANAKGAAYASKKTKSSR